MVVWETENLCMKTTFGEKEERKQREERDRKIY